jgi:anti-anti-sigma factor
MLATRSNEYLLDAWSNGGHAVHLHLGGELDLATKPFLDKLLSRAEVNGIDKIVVDLENVTFMSVSTLRSFTRAAGRASRSGRTFTLVAAPPVVRRIFEITGTLDLLGPECDSPSEIDGRWSFPISRSTIG